MREFLTRHRPTIIHWIMEVVVVVIGVLLALSVQQWAETRASQQRGNDAEARIREELLSATFDVVERIAVHGCLKQRLIDLGDGVIAGGPNWRPTALPEPAAGRLAFGRVYRVPSRTFSSEAFRGAVNGGDLASLAPERIVSMSAAYGMLAKIEQLNLEENQLAAGLGSLQFPVARTPADRSTILSTLTRLDHLNQLLNLIAGQHLGQVRRIGLTLTAAEKDRVRRGGFTAKWAAEGRAKYGRCFNAAAMAALENGQR